MRYLFSQISRCIRDSCRSAKWAVAALPNCSIFRAEESAFGRYSHPTSQKPARSPSLSPYVSLLSPKLPKVFFFVVASGRAVHDFSDSRKIKRWGAEGILNTTLLYNTTYYYCYSLLLAWLTPTDKAVNGLEVPTGRN